MGVIEVPIPFALGFGAGILLAVLLRDASILRWVFQSLTGCVLGILFMLVGLFLVGHFHRQSGL
jgi:succinate dehydrogenase/fumarate reductase cytochrome b subunit